MYDLSNLKVRNADNILKVCGRGWGVGGRQEEAGRGRRAAISARPSIKQSTHTGLEFGRALVVSWTGRQDLASFTLSVPVFFLLSSDFIPTFYCLRGPGEGSEIRRLR